MSQNTIKLKSYSSVQLEKDAVAEIYPGMLLELTSADEVQAHSTAAANATPVLIALEDELVGNEITDPYAADDKVGVWIPVPGDEAYMILNDGETVVIGGALESAGNGYLQAHAVDTLIADSIGVLDAAETLTVYTKPIVAIALEAVDLSASSGESGESSGAIGEELGFSQRIKVRIV